MPKRSAGCADPRVSSGRAKTDPRLLLVILVIALSAVPTFATSHPCFTSADAKALAQQGIQDLCTINGVVTLAPGANAAAPGEFIMEDKTGGLLIAPPELKSLSLWDNIEVRGRVVWLKRTETGTTLAGVPGIRLVPESIAIVASPLRLEGRQVSLAEAKSGRFVDDLVRVKGTVLRIVMGESKAGSGEVTDYFVLGPEPEVWVCVQRMRSDPSWVKALAEPGSEVEATGVSVYSRTAQEYRVQMRTPTDVAILRTTSWFTRSHVLGVVGGVLFVLCLGLLWILLLKRTIRKRTEEIREREQLLRQAQKMDVLNQLAGGIAHDFNNVLMAISGYSELLRDVAENDQQKQIVDEILKASGRGAGLTRQLLAFSRRNPTTPAIVDVNELVNDLLPMISRLVGEDIRVSTRTGVAPATIRADRVQLEQVLINLVANARDAMPAGGFVSTEVDIITLAKPKYPLSAGKYVRLAVSDTGCGMDAATAAKAFEPFFTTKAIGKGTGLGLSTVYGIIRQNDGDISIESKPGQGTTFTILIPFKAGKAARDRAVIAAAKPKNCIGRVLIVEDEDQIRESITKYVQRMGYEVTSAANPSDAIQASQGRELDLLITDIVMPDMSGIELFDQLSSSIPSLKVIFISGYSDRVVEYGARYLRGPLLKKPFQLSELAEMIQSILPGAASPGANSQENERSTESV